MDGTKKSKSQKLFVSNFWPPPQKIELVRGWTNPTEKIGAFRQLGSFPQKIGVKIPKKSIEKTASFQEISNPNGPKDTCVSHSLGVRW